MHSYISSFVDYNKINKCNPKNNGNIIIFFAIGVTWKMSSQSVVSANTQIPSWGELVLMCYMYLTKAYTL